MKKRWLSQPMTFACVLLTLTVGKAQDRTVLAKLSATAAPSIFVQLSDVAQWSGPKIAGSEVIVVIAPEIQDHLLALLHKYPQANWLITLTGGSEGPAQITSAYRQDSPSHATITHPPLTEPLRAPAELAQPYESKTSRSLAIGDEELEVVHLTNLARKDEGLAPLKQVGNLHNSADGHSNRMATMDFFAHCDIHSKKSPFVRMRDAGYNWNAAAENIAAGQNTAQEVMYSSYGWMNSPGHRANILSTSYRELGVGYEFSNDSNKDVYDQNGDCDGDASGGPFRRYWTQNFGKRNTVYPVVINLEAEVTDSRTVNLYVYGPSGSEEMRFKNGNNDWSAWMTYAPNHSWRLDDRNGTQVVHSQVRKGSSTYTSKDEIILDAQCGTLIVQNENLTGTQTLDDCEVILRRNVQVTGKITINADEVSIESDNEVKAGATLEIKPGN